MANDTHFQMLLKGANAWNHWRLKNPDVIPDLRGADLRGKNLGGTNLSGTNLAGAKLDSTDFTPLFRQAVPVTRITRTGERITSKPKRKYQSLQTDLTGANLNEASLKAANLGAVNLSRSYLVNADLSGASLTTTDLRWANLYSARLIGANLSQVKLDGANLVEADFSNARLSDCHVYGVSVWKVCLSDTIQRGLIVTPPGEPVISVDNLEIAQFIYLLLNNESIRNMIDTITTKVVLILGRFTKERKNVLDAIRESLHRYNYVPIILDFDKPGSRTTVETITTIAQMARFVIADLTDAKSVLQELQAIVPQNPSVPIRPLLLASQQEPGMLDYFKPYSWFLDVYHYQSQQELIGAIEEVIAPIEAKVKEIRGSLV